MIGMVKCPYCEKEMSTNEFLSHVETHKRESAREMLRVGVYRPLFPPKPSKPISRECKEELREYFRSRADFWIKSLAGTASLYHKGQMTREAAKSDVEMESHYLAEDKGIVEDLYGPSDPLWGYYDKIQGEAQLYLHL